MITVTAILLAGDVHHHRQHFVCWSLTISLTITVTQIRSRSAGIMIDVCQPAVGMRRCVRRFGPWKALGRRLRWSARRNCHFHRENDDQLDQPSNLGARPAIFREFFPWRHPKPWQVLAETAQHPAAAAWGKRKAEELMAGNGKCPGCRPSAAGERCFWGIWSQNVLLENGSDMWCQEAELCPLKGFQIFFENDLATLLSKARVVCCRWVKALVTPMKITEIQKSKVHSFHMNHTNAEIHQITVDPKYFDLTDLTWIPVWMVTLW